MFQARPADLSSVRRTTVDHAVAISGRSGVSRASEWARSADAFFNGKPRFMIGDEIVAEITTAGKLDMKRPVKECEEAAAFGVWLVVTFTEPYPAPTSVELYTHLAGRAVYASGWPTARLPLTPSGEVNAP
jgi:hypothetical protein